MEFFFLKIEKLSVDFITLYNYFWVKNQEVFS